MDQKAFLEHHYDLEADLGLPRSFLVNLWHEKGDDWSFIIKLHALLEAALSQVLAAAVTKQEVAALFRKLNIRGQVGKIAFAGAFGAIQKPHSRFLESFTTLRNMLVHDIHQVSFSLRDHVANLQPDKRAGFLRNLLFVVDHSNPEAREKALTLFERNPKFVLFGHAMIVLTHGYIFKKEIGWKASQEAKYREFTERVFKEWTEDPGATNGGT